MRKNLDTYQKVYFKLIKISVNANCIFGKKCQAMSIYLLAVIIVVSFITIFFYVEYAKKKVFDDYLDLNVSLSFTDNRIQKSKSRYGLLMFHIQDLENEPRALSINHVKLHASKLQLRSHNNLYAKFPLPKEGVILSVGVKKSGKGAVQDLSNMYVTISGFILEDKNQKKSFKRKLPITYQPSPKIVSIIQK